jgi:ABC-type transporter Mla subunit MlaD
MNSTVKNQKIQIPSEQGTHTDVELKQAELQARQSQRELDRSLDQLPQMVATASGAVQERVGTFVHDAENRLHQVRNQVESGVQRVEGLMTDSKSKLDETFSRADSVVGDLTSGFGQHVDQVQQIVGRVRGSVEQSVQQIDQFAGRLEGIIGGVRQEFEQGAEGIFGHAEELTRNLRSSISSGSEQIKGLMDRADEVVRGIRDPVGYVSRNPRLAIGTLLLGGLVLGLFFRNLFTGEASGTLSGISPSSNGDFHKAA